MIHLKGAATTLLLSGLSLAVPTSLEGDIGVFMPPLDSDIRSPCPGLNSLANHGYLPRDGKNIHATDIVTAMDKYLGIAVSS
jgi:hypothetical protein